LCENQDCTAKSKRVNLQLQTCNRFLILVLHSLKKCNIFFLLDAFERSTMTKGFFAGSCCAFSIHQFRLEKSIISSCRGTNGQTYFLFLTRRRELLCFFFPARGLQKRFATSVSLGGSHVATSTGRFPRGYIFSTKSMDCAPCTIDSSFFAAFIPKRHIICKPNPPIHSQALDSLLHSCRYVAF